MKFAIPFLLLAASAPADMRVVALPGKSPLVTFRIVFTSGSAADPEDKPGLASLTAAMLANSGTREMTYRQIVDAMFPMAASFDVQVDREMCTFTGETHADNLQAYYKLLRALLLDPGWREDDFRRVRDDAVNAIKVGLRGNDEELGKEVLEQNLFQGTAYGHYTGGTVGALESMTLDDVKQFYRHQYTQANLILGIAGGYPSEFLKRIKDDFRALPPLPEFRTRALEAAQIDGTRVVIVDKDTRSVAYSLGFPISVTRSSADYAALLVASSYLGQHRMSGGVLYDRIREQRGLNYGDYSYIEAFPNGGSLLEPNPNTPRRHQIFQLWIRPVEPATAKFTLRLALYELDKFVKDGIPEEGFVRTRDFVSKFVNVLTRTKRAELGYAIDSLFYGTGNYNQTLKAALAKLTRDDVNRAIRAHLRSDRMVIAVVGKNGAELQRSLASEDASPMTYNSPKPASLTGEDKIVEKWALHLRASDFKVIPADQVFQ